MRRISVSLITALSTTALTQIVSAADMPVKAPVKAPVIAPLYNWTGPYAGVVGGYGWGNSKQTNSGLPKPQCIDFEGQCIGGGTADGSYSMQGGFIGGALGYNWQQAHWIFGVEGDYSWAGIKGSSNTCGVNSPTPHACGTELDLFGTLRARIGYSMGANGNWLPYVTGGLAVGQVKAWDALFPASGSDFRAGWTIGGGLETGITRSWTFKVEYLYIDLGSRETFNVCAGRSGNG